MRHSLPITTVMKGCSQLSRRRLAAPAPSTFIMSRAKVSQIGEAKLATPECNACVVVVVVVVEVEVGVAVGVAVAFAVVVCGGLWWFVWWFVVVLCWLWF